MKKLEWKHKNDGWELYDGNKKVGIISYIDDPESKLFGLWAGSFATSDDKFIEVSPVGTAILQAKQRIEGNYMEDRSFEWWMK